MKYTIPELWRDVPGYDGRYQASTWGEIRRRTDRGWQLLKAHVRPHSKNCHVQKVWLIEGDGHRVERSVLNTIALTWCLPPPGYVAIHRNGIYTENGVENILFVTRKKLVDIYANRAKRRAVLRIDSNGNPVECYPSAKAAARACYMNPSTLCNHLNGVVKHPVCTDGIQFRWDD